MTKLADENGELSIIFISPGNGDIPTGPDTENMVGNEDIESLGRLVSSGPQVPGVLVRCRARTRHLL
jgi:hypothetical protein